MLDALETIKEAQELISSLLEDGEEEVEQEVKDKKVNKIKRPKVGAKNVDVVSVEDELFPYDGTAKQQYNQKIIDKLNEIIEGKATLEDLIRLVRQRRAYKKRAIANEELSELVKNIEILVEEFKK